MKLSQNNWFEPLSLGAVLVISASACGGKANAGKSVASTTPSAQSTSSTSVTGANQKGPQSGPRSGLHVSDDIRRACGITVPEQNPKFEFDSSDISPEDRDVLTQVARCLTSGPLKGRSVRLVGRADARGEDEYNMALGALRAASVRDYLSSLGVEKGKISETSRGELDATGHDEASHRIDRRVDVELVK